MFNTRLTELLGVEYPIIGGAMAYLTTGEFAAAVSNAGGFGLISSVSWESKEELREQIHICRSKTDKPFGVNIALITRDPAKIDNDIQVVIDEGIEFVETAALNPAPFIARLKEAGIKIMHKCATVKHAQSAERAGADAVTLVGYEAAGHTGLDEMALSILIPMAVDSLKVPVIAAGGVADGRAFLANLALGASGVQIGTRFMATQECPAHPRFKELLLRTEATGTVHVERSIGRNYRVLNNDAARRMLEMEKRGAGIEELLTIIGRESYTGTVLLGKTDAGAVACGQVVGQLVDIPTVKEIIDRIIGQARTITEKLYASSRQ
ncbi:MAG: nitronate monooxygenase [Dehalococcoidia bacterium]|nr:nitronate monooxygenase [Dehalococcoidia bacterium]